MTIEKLERANEIAAELEYLKHGAIFSIKISLGVYNIRFEDHPDILAKKEEIKNIVARIVYEETRKLTEEFENL